MQRGFNHSIGNDFYSEFWTDYWTGRERLSPCFPGFLFSRWLNKEQFPSSGFGMGGYGDGVCNFIESLGLRKGCLGAFLRFLEGIFLDESAEDKIIWSPSLIGRYSCKSFRIRLQLL